MATMIENYVKIILKLYEQYIKDYYQDKINMIIESGKGKVVIKTRVCLLLRDGKIVHFLMGGRQDSSGRSGCRTGLLYRD